MLVLLEAYQIFIYIFFYDFNYVFIEESYLVQKGQLKFDFITYHGVHLFILGSFLCYDFIQSEIFPPKGRNYKFICKILIFLQDFHLHNLSFSLLFLAHGFFLLFLGFCLDYGLGFFKRNGILFYILLLLHLLYFSRRRFFTFAYILLYKNFNQLIRIERL